MRARWRRGCLAIAAALVLACGGGYVATSARASPISPPAELLRLGPLWLGDHCRENVRHGRYPPSWCPAEYNLSLIVRGEGRGAIYRLMTLRNVAPPTRP